MQPPDAQQVARRLLVLSGLVAYMQAMPPPEIWNQFASRWTKQEQDDFFEKFKKIPQSIANFLKSNGVWENMSPKESDFLHAYPQDLKDQQKVSMSWRMESAVTLMWALGMVDDLPPFDLETNTALLKEVPKQNVLAFIDSAKLRAPDEIESKRSLAETWHWRSRTRRLIEEKRPFPNMPQFKSYDEIVRFTAKAAGEMGNIATCHEDFQAKNKAYRDLTDEEWSEVESITIERHFALNWLCGYAPGNCWDETPTGT